MQLGDHKQNASPVHEPLHDFQEEAVEVELPFLPTFSWTSQTSMRPFLTAYLKQTSAQPIKVTKHCQIRHKLYQCNSRHFTMTSEWPITEWQLNKKSALPCIFSQLLCIVTFRPVTLTGSQVTVWGHCKVKPSLVLFIQLWCLTVWFIRIYKCSNGVTTRPPRMAGRVNCNSHQF